MENFGYVRRFENAVSPMQMDLLLSKAAGEPRHCEYDRFMRKKNKKDAKLGFITKILLTLNII